MDNNSEVPLITNHQAGGPIMDDNPILTTDYLNKMLRATGSHSIEKFYCYSDHHGQDIDQLEILIDLTSFWLILEAKEKLEDPDWWGHDDSDTLVDVESDLKCYTSGCTIDFKSLSRNGNRVSIAVYYYNSMELRMAQAKFDPVIDPAKCMQDNIIKWIENKQLSIKNIVFPDYKAIERKKKQQAIARANELKKQQSKING